jgi:hypothetical protein
MQKVTPTPTPTPNPVAQTLLLPVASNSQPNTQPNNLSDVSVNGTLPVPVQAPKAQRSQNNNVSSQRVQSNNVSSQRVQSNNVSSQRVQSKPVQNNNFTNNTTDTSLASLTEVSGNDNL